MRVGVTQREEATRGWWLVSTAARTVGSTISALDGDFREASLFAHLDELVAAFPAADVFAVDIPIGYPQGAPRGADIEARKFVGRRHASVFPTPPRKALIAGNYEDAVTIARALTGRGISRQSFALCPTLL